MEPITAFLLFVIIFEVVVIIVIAKAKEDYKQKYLNGILRPSKDIYVHTEEYNIETLKFSVPSIDQNSDRHKSFYESVIINEFAEKLDELGLIEKEENEHHVTYSHKYIIKK